MPPDEQAGHSDRFHHHHDHLYHHQGDHDDEKPEGGGNPSKGVPCNEQSWEWGCCMLFPLKSTGSIPNLQRTKDQGLGSRVKDLAILTSRIHVVSYRSMSCHDQNQDQDQGTTFNTGL